MCRNNLSRANLTNEILIKISFDFSLAFPKSTQIKPKGTISWGKANPGANTAYLYHYCFRAFCAWGAFYQWNQRKRVRIALAWASSLMRLDTSLISDNVFVRNRRYCLLLVSQCRHLDLHAKVETDTMPYSNSTIPYTRVHHRTQSMDRRCGIVPEQAATDMLEP